MEYNLGKVLLTPKGNYNGSTAYEILDVVTYNGSSYVAKQSTTGNAPTDGQTNTYWQLLAYGAEGGSGSSTDVRINDVSITNNDIANILTEGNYDGTSNKLATMSEIPTVPQISTNIEADGSSDAKTVSPKAVKTFVETNFTPTSQLSAVATSGSYNDLINKPTIPDVSGKEDSSNKVSTIAGYETNTTKYPNTKAVADYAQTIGNKVISFQSTPDDTHYPSEKLVKDSLDTKIDNTDVEALTAIDVDNTPTANSSNLVTSGGIYDALINKQDKMLISSASGTTLSAIANTYHNFTSEVNTLAITLPAVTDVTHITNIVFMLTTGTTPAITFAASGTGVNVIAQDGFSIEASTTYEINAIFNGTIWVVAAMKLSTTPINS